MNPISIPYQGTALPEDTDTELLFNSENLVPQGACNMLELLGVKRWSCAIAHNQDGSVVGSRRDTGSSNWRVFYNSGALTATTTKGSDNRLDVDIAGLGEVKFEWVNTVTVTLFDVTQALHCDRASAAMEAAT